MLKNINRRNLLISLALLIGLGLAIYLASFLPTADWFATFDPAARGIFSGLAPYHQVGYVYPPWAVIPLLPIVLFPPDLAHGLMYVLSALLLFYILWRLKVGVVAAVAFFLSPTAIGALMVNNIDPIVISGILFPPIWGLFLLVIKPQIGFGVAVYYLVEIWREHGFQGALRVFAPVSIAWLVSAALFPIWIERMLRNPEIIWNRSLFPYLIPLGLILLWMAFRYKNPYFAMASSLFFAPYHSFYSYIVVQIGLMHPDVEKVIRRDVLQVGLSVFFWVVLLYFRL
jgi:hypothetical protein